MWSERLLRIPGTPSNHWKMKRSRGFVAGLTGVRKERGHRNGKPRGQRSRERHQEDRYQNDSPSRELDLRVFDSCCPKQRARSTREHRGTDGPLRQREQNVFRHYLPPGFFAAMRRASCCNSFRLTMSLSTNPTSNSSRDPPQK